MCRPPRCRRGRARVDVLAGLSLIPHMRLLRFALALLVTNTAAASGQRRSTTPLPSGPWSIGTVARDLDLTPSALGLWVRHARADRSKGKTGLTTEERAELGTLRKEVRELRMERDVLKKATAFFAKSQS